MKHSKSIKRITVKNLVLFLLIANVIQVLIIALSFRLVSHTIVKNQAFSISEVVIAGLTSHMKAGTIKNRHHFLNEIKSIRNINKLNIVRSHEVVEQFGPGLDIEKEVDSDPVTSKAFQSKNPVFNVNDFSTLPTIRAVVPYIASKQGSLNCLVCHRVEENTVLGALDMELNIKSYQEMAINVIFALFILSILITLIIAMNTFHTVERYIRKPLESLISRAHSSFTTQTPLDPGGFESLEFENVANEINLFNASIIKKQIELKGINKQLSRLNDEIEDTLRETVFTMGVILEERCKETKNHTLRVTEYCRLLAQKSGLSTASVDLIAMAASLHDIGKIGIPDELLLKPGKLSREEYEMMKRHTVIGYAMLRHSKRDILAAAATIAHQHHERWDGSGYPQGLKGKEIDIFGRIAALADVFDALISERVYKEAWSMEECIDWMSDEKGKHFDPDLVDIFIANQGAFYQIYSENK